MKEKKIGLYTEEEREALLIHWWQSYGRVNVNLTEVEQFLELIKQDSGLVFDIALVSSLLGKTTEPLVYAIRTNTLSNFIESVNKAVASDKYQNMRRQLENDLLNKLVHSYNSRATVCLSNDQEQLAQLLDAPIAKKHIPLTVEKVFDVYAKCRLTLEETAPYRNSPTVCGRIYCTRFHASRLAEEREKIIALIDQVPGIDEGIFTSKMRFDKTGKIWTDGVAVDWLVELGTALGVLDFSIGIDNGEFSLYVSRNKEKDIPKVFNKKSDECTKDI